MINLLIHLLYITENPHINHKKILPLEITLINTFTNKKKYFVGQKYRDKFVWYEKRLYCGIDNPAIYYFLRPSTRMTNWLSCEFDMYLYHNNIKLNKKTI